MENKGLMFLNTVIHLIMIYLNFKGTFTFAQKKMANGEETKNMFIVYDRSTLWATNNG